MIHTELLDDNGLRALIASYEREAQRDAGTKTQQHKIGFRATPAYRGGASRGKVKRRKVYLPDGRLATSPGGF